jgi:chloramphenicol 3-O phosphotransferase
LATDFTERQGPHLPVAGRYDCQMLIVLSGSSSSGKTSLARAIQELSERPLLRIEADLFLSPLPKSKSALLDAGFRERALSAMHEAIAAFGRAGFDVIVDGSLPVESHLRERCLAILRAAAPTCLVRVGCSTEVLRRREALRPDREIGWAEHSTPSIDEGMIYDIEVDTSECSPSEVAATLLSRLFRSGPES